MVGLSLVCVDRNFCIHLS